MTKRILADMSATLLHHGHIRILRAAKEHGHVIVALTTDDEVEKYKGFVPELDFASRKEILESIRFVDEVVPSPWIITNQFLNDHQIDLLIHGGESGNEVDEARVLTLPRTEGISSAELRSRIAASAVQD